MYQMFVLLYLRVKENYCSNTSWYSSIFIMKEFFFVYI